MMIENCLEMLGITDLEQNDKEFVLNEISKYIFDTKNNNSNAKKTFDLNLDYKYYFVDFLKLGINLNKQDIDWWEFDSILESLFLDENSNLSKMLSHRLYKKPSKNYKTQEAEEHRYRLEMRQRYALPVENNNIEDGFNKLWSYVENKAKKERR